MIGRWGVRCPVNRIKLEIIRLVSGVGIYEVRTDEGGRIRSSHQGVCFEWA